MSTASDSPRTPRRYESRPAAAAWEPPGSAVVGIGPHRPNRRLQVAIIGRAHAHENADLALRQTRRHDAGIFQRFPVHLQQLPLLGIHELRFARRDPEEPRAEIVEFGNECPEPGVKSCPARRDQGRSKIDIPAVYRYSLDCVATAREEIQNSSGLAPP